MSRQSAGRGAAGQQGGDFSLARGEASGSLQGAVSSLIELAQRGPGLRHRLLYRQQLPLGMQGLNPLLAEALACPRSSRIHSW